MAGRSNEKPPVYLLHEGRVQEWNEWIYKQSEVRIIDVDFSGCKLDGALFTIPTRESSGKTKTKPEQPMKRNRLHLSGVTFSNCRLVDVNFTDANLNDVSFRDESVLQRVNFDCVTVRNTGNTLFSVENSFYDCSFSSAHFSFADFTKSTFRDCKFINTDLSQAKFPGTDLEDCMFDSCSLDSTGWQHGNLCRIGVFGWKAGSISHYEQDADFEGTLDQADFSHATLHEVAAENIGFWRSRWQGSIVQECMFNECSFVESNITLARFKSCDFIGADFQELTIEKSFFTYCGLDGINVTGWHPSELTIIKPEITRARFGPEDSDIVQFKIAEEFVDEAKSHLTEEHHFAQETTPFLLGEPKAVCFTHETGRSPHYLMTEDEVQEMIEREREFEHFLVCYKEYSRISKKSGRRRPEENITSAELEVLIAYLQRFVKHESPIMPSRLLGLRHTTTPDSRRKHFFNLRRKLDAASDFRLFKKANPYIEVTRHHEVSFIPDSDATYCLIIDAGFYLTY